MFVQEITGLRRLRLNNIDKKLVCLLVISDVVGLFIEYCQNKRRYEKNFLT